MGNRPPARREASSPRGQSGVSFISDRRGREACGLEASSDSGTAARGVSWLSAQEEPVRREAVLQGELGPTSDPQTSCLAQLRVQHSYLPLASRAPCHLCQQTLLLSDSLDHFAPHLGPLKTSTWVHRMPPLPQVHNCMCVHIVGYVIVCANVYTHTCSSALWTGVWAGRTEP